MKVSRTIGQMYLEIQELKKMRDSAEKSIARYASMGREDLLPDAIEEYRHFDKLIDYYWQKEIEFDDMFAEVE